MTCAKRSGKKPLSSKATLLALALLAALLLPLGAFAQPAGGGGLKQFQRPFMIGGRISAVILIVGWDRDTKDVEKLLDIVSAKAAEAYARLDWQNSGSEVAKLNAAAGGGAQPVSEDVIAAFEAAQQVAEWTGGAFDIASAGPGNYRDISVKSKGGTVELKKPGMQVRFDGIIDGFLSELMVRYIFAAGMQNAMVKVGTTFRGVGQAIMGPWKIQVQDDAGTFARHALNLTVSNTAIATVSANQFRSQPLVDPRSKETVAPPCRGVTVVMNDAAHAAGLADAVFLLGPDEGQKLLGKLGNAKALIVDANGKFIRTKGF
jgi:FAD:protein FMN transferase